MKSQIDIILCEIPPWEWDKLDEEERELYGPDKESIYIKNIVIKSENNSLMVDDRVFDITNDELDYDEGLPYTQDLCEEIDVCSLMILDHMILYLLEKKNEEINKKVYIADGVIYSDAEEVGIQLPQTGSGMMDCDFPQLVKVV